MECHRPALYGRCDMEHRSWMRLTTGSIVSIVLLVLCVYVGNGSVQGDPGSQSPLGIHTSVLRERAAAQPAEPTESLEQGPANQQEAGPALGWQIECVDCPPMLGSMGDRHLALDAASHPHLVYGGDHLYYAWHDGNAWHHEVADWTPQVGSMTALVLDAASQPHVVYRGWGPLYYAYRDATGWHTTVLDRFDPQSIQQPAIILGATGQPQVAYGSRTALRYAWYDGSAWLTETVDLCYPGGITQDLDPAGHPHVFYSGGRRHAWHDGTAWFTETLPLGAAVGYPVSLEIDKAGHMHLAYVQWALDDPCYPAYAYNDGASWFTQTLDTPTDFITNITLALDPAGRPHLAYADFSYGLHHAWQDAFGWQYKVLESDWAAYCSLAIDDSGQLYLSYRYHGDRQELRLARFTGSSWQTEVVIQGGIVGDYPVLALDAADRPHIIYRDGPSSGQGAIKYAWFDGVDWQMEIVDTAGNLGYWGNDLVIDYAGRPHAVYGDWDSAEIRYACRISDTWQVETVVNKGHGHALAVDAAGRPHIAYYDYRADGIWYAYKDASSWHMQQVDATGWSYPSLQLDDSGNPSLCYEGKDSTLRYAWFDGGSWYTQTVDGQEAAAACSLALDGAGQPRIVYTVNRIVHYAWRDAGVWHTLAVDAGTTWNGCNSLALDAAGRPHISYYDDGNDDLRHAWFNGTGWATDTVDSPGQMGGRSSIAMDCQGRPRIAYLDRTCGDLRYAAASTPGLWQVFYPLVSGYR